MRLEEALFNWLQIKIVAVGRPDDGAARETVAFFETVLREDHQVEAVEIGGEDETMYRIVYVQNGRKKTQWFDRESAGRLLMEINANPKYNE